MRSLWMYISLVVIFIAVSVPSVSAKPYPVRPRADPPSPSKAASSSDITANENTSTAGPRDETPPTTDLPTSSRSAAAAARTSDHHTETDTQKSSSPTSVKTTSTPAIPSGSAAVGTAKPSGNENSTAPTNGTTNGDQEELPIHPTITPALSVAGVYLILSGGFYLLIGIKTKWLHVFLSTAYLTSVAVTVLIIYVMHPPISNAIQGAYLVAAFLTGIAFGGGSLVFSDVTEGLGCLFGGFCLSMWFLVLKPGGLLSSTTGKAIFIACCTLGAFGFYISHVTRPYGLIVSISFGGASVIVLGIDCFSRAGLKEFWLYIWDLNDNLFPLHYNKPYPITRGIRVEIACIILLFLLGIMSQMKVWKIIKERRDEKAAAQLAEEHRRDQAEEDIGKRLEEGNERERAMWESAYGEQDHSKQKQIDSGVGTDASGSVRKSSLSAVGTREIRNSISESMEMSNLDAPNGPSRKASQDGSQENSRMMVQVASDDRIPSESHEHSKHENRLSEISTGTSIPDPSASMTRIAPSADLLATAAIHDNAIDRSRYHSGPKITPLPFKVPDSNAEDARDDVSSIATCAASERYTDRGSKRMSRGSLLKSLSRRSQRHSRNPSDSNEALIIPHVEEDCASSVAATIDGVSADRDSHNDGASADGRMPAHSDDELEDSGVRPLSLDPTIVGEGIANSSLIADLMREGDEETQYLPGKGKENPMNRVTVAGIERNPEESTLEPFHEGSFAGVKKPGKLPKSLELLGKGQDDSQNKDSTSNSEIGSNQSNHTKLSGNLPESSSKVVMAYRTNEWAKHLESAEKPELDDLDTERVPSGVTSMETKETAAPVRVDDLKQTPLTAEPAPIQTDRPQQPALNRSSSSKDSLSRQASSQQVANRRRHPSGTNVERSSSQTSLQTIQNKRESSSSTLNRLPSSQLSPTNTRGFRSSSTPLLTSPLVESPIEEGIESSFPIRFTPSPMHLMSQRDTMVRNKMSSTSLNRTSSTPSLNPIASASNESFPPQNLPTLDEDISLATRKTLLQQNPSRSSLALQQHPSRSSLAIQQANPSPAPLPTPNRSSSNPRESTLSAWRSSLRAGLPTQQAAQQEIEARRTEMMHEKRRASNSQQWAQLEQGKGESILDRGMRRGDLLDKHREAMRRMQGEANRNL